MCHVHDTCIHILWMSEISAIPHGSSGANVAKAIKWFISILSIVISIFFAQPEEWFRIICERFYFPVSNVWLLYWIEYIVFASETIKKRMFRIVSIFCDFPVKISRVTYDLADIAQLALHFLRFFGNRKKVNSYECVCLPSSIVVNENTVKT